MGILDKKVVLITGSGGGLGRVAAQTFAREGAKVVGCDIKVDANISRNNTNRIFVFVRVISWIVLAFAKPTLKLGHHQRMTSFAKIPLDKGRTLEAVSMSDNAMKKARLPCFCPARSDLGKQFHLMKWAAEDISPSQIVLLRVVFGFLPANG